MKTQVSVVIPVYNGKVFLKDTLSCLSVQSHPISEVLIIDDCSTDGSADLSISWGQQLNLPVRVIRMPQNSGGPVGPMNLGIQEASSPIIALCDQDDLLPPDRLERQVMALDDCPSAGLACGVNIAVDSHGNRIGQYTRSADIWAKVPGEIIRDDLRLISAQNAYLSFLREGQSVGGASSMCFPKQVWSELGGIDPSFRVCWDYEFAVRIATRYDIVYDANPLSFHRIHESNLGHRIDIQTVEYDSIRMRHFQNPAFAIDPVELRQSQIQTAAQLAFNLRSQGKYRLSAGYYLSQFGYGGRLGALSGLAKLAIASVTPSRMRRLFAHS